MADRTVRTIFEADTSSAQKNLADLGKDAQDVGQKADKLTKDLKALDGLSATPEVDVKIDAAERELADLKLTLADLKSMDASPEVDVEIAETERKIREVRGSLNELKGSKIEARLDVATKDAEKRLSQVKADLGELRTLKATPEVRADIAAAQKNLREVQAELRELRGAKAQLTVTADTSQVDSELEDLGDVGEDVGDDIGGGMVSGIVGALQSIPIAGVIVGVGAAIAGGLVLGIQQGLAIEAERDLFSARTGLDEATSAKFGRAAGEAYANAWGDSVATNLETARIALEQGLIDEDAIATEIQSVIESLSGISEIMQVDIPEAARAAGQLIKTDLADNVDEAFDIIIAGFQNGADASDDFLDTLTEYSSFFQQMGIDGETATGLLIQGLEGGAVSADKVADALKELVVSFTTGDQAAVRWAEVTGESWEKVASAFNEGGPAAEEALNGVFEALSAIEDPAQRSQLALELMKSAGEDLGPALDNLNLATAADELEQVGSSAGSAAEALATMADNTATQMESAKRNVEIAMDGIKGALAAAFADDIDAAAKWVAANRAPLMEFFAGVVTGTIEMAKGFVEFSASALESVASVLDSFSQMQDLIYIIAPASRLFFDDFGDGADTLRQRAADMRTGVIESLDGMQEGFNNWAGAEIMQARVHDATVAMTADLDAFLANVNTSEGTVTINGDQVPAEEVLNVLVENIDGSDGTVVINGDKVPADQALDTLLALINSSKEDVTIGGIPDPAIAELRALEQMIAQAEEDVKINGDDALARATLDALRLKVEETRAAIGVDADTTDAHNTIQSFIFRNRTVYIDVVARGGQMVPGSHSGGWVKGLAAGGWVPGSDPGYDNVLWPLNSGGRTLQQPLAGGEYVVNSRAASYWAQALEAINAGYRPAASSSPGMVRLDPGDIDRLAVEVGRRVEAGANRGLQQIGRGL